MSDDRYQPDALDELPGELRVAVQLVKQRPIPEAAMQRALERAAQCGSSVQMSEPRSSRPRKSASRPKALVRWAIAAAACVAIVAWLGRPADLWADVVKAVQARPWIHLTRSNAEPGQSADFWLSTSRGVGGGRSSEQISFFDERLGIVQRYNLKEKVLYRLPASTEYGELAEAQKLLGLFQGLFRGDAQLKAGFPGMILQGQKRRQVEKDGRTWDEYELQFQIPSQPAADARMVFVVDAQTHLPHSMTTNNGQWNFDYPETGPADVYALGVPRDAQLVDRVPTGDMSRILAAMQAGRDRFDDFHSIVIRDLPADMSPGQGGGRKFPKIFVMWKKGTRWRTEIAIGAALLEPPAPGQDKRDWVREACRKTIFTTMNICDGQAVYRGEMPGEGRKRDNFELRTTPDQASSLEGMQAMPSTWCYPLTLNPPNDRTEETVYPKPTDGPPNTILVTSRVMHPRPNEIPYQKFWLDPARGYAAARIDLLNREPTEPAGQRDLQELMDQWQQTPGGIWYPTRVGTGLTKELPAGGTWYHFFLNFPPDMPAELFQPAKRTVLTDDYPVGS